MTDFIQELLRKREKKLALYFSFTLPYIDGILSLINYKCDFVDCIYPVDLEIKDKKDPVIYVPLHLKHDHDGR